MIYSIVNLKGGCGKTTTATYLTAGLYARDGSATEIDSDDQGSALSWAEQVEPPWLTVSMGASNSTKKCAIDAREMGVVVTTRLTPERMAGVR